MCLVERVGVVVRVHEPSGTVSSREEESHEGMVGAYEDSTDDMDHEEEGRGGGVNVDFKNLPFFW